MNDFQKFLKENKLKQAEVAEYLSVAPSFITKLIAGERKISPEKLDRLRERAGWDTTMLTPSSGRPGPKGQEKLQRPLPLLPFDAVAGYMNDNNRMDAFRGDAVTFSDFIERGADCVIRVGGDSMYPRYKNGDVLAIKILHDPSFFQWGRVYVLNTTQGCIVKMLFQDPEDAEKIVCHSENTRRYPDYTIHKSDIISVALVVGHAGVE